MVNRNDMANRIASTSQELPLPDLLPGLCATITQITADDEDQQRLKAMGVCLGRRVELVKAGDPLILRVLGTRIGVSARLAKRVYLMPASESNPCCPTGLSHSSTK